LSPRSTIGFVQNDFWALGTFGANCARRSSIWCVQNDFRAYDTFGTNCVAILRQD
jgi:hypothetical protein